MTVVRTLPELSYATGIAAKLTAKSSNMVRTITLLARSCRWCKPPSLIPGRNSSDQTDNFDSPFQGVESDIKIPVQIIESTVDVVCKRAHGSSESTDYCCDQIPG